MEMVRSRLSPGEAKKVIQAMLAALARRQDPRAGRLFDSYLHSSALDGEALSRRDDALRETGIALAALDRWGVVEKIGALFEVPATCAQMWWCIGEMLHADQDGHATEAFGRAEEAMSRSGNEYHRAELVEVLARTERYDRARDLAIGIGREDVRIKSLNGIVVERIRTGVCEGPELEKACQAAEAVPYGPAAAELLRVLAGAACAAGLPAADDVAGKAWQTARNLDNDGGTRAFELCKLAQGLFAEGWYRAEEILEEAFAAADSVGGYRRAEALAKVADVFIKVSRIKQAKEILLGLDPGFHREWGLKEVVRALAGSGRFKQAGAVLKDLEEAQYRSAALAMLAAAHDREGDERLATELFGQALEMARHIENPDKRGSCLMEVAAALTDAGRLEEAATASAALADDWKRERALRQIAEAYLAGGKFSSALDTAETETLDELIRLLAQWVQPIEKQNPGLGDRMLATAAAVAAWVRPDWAQVHREFDRALPLKHP
jgi:hypothetical protein